MMKKLFFILLLVIISFNISGCSMLQSPSSLMSTPNTYIEGESSKEIKDLLTKYNYVITAPIRGKEKRSIIRMDLNNDSKDELIVLYKKTNEDARYGFLILTTSNESLRIICNETFQCKNIDNLNFTDIDNDNTKEILITTSSVDNNDTILNIYKFNGKTMAKLFSKVCTDFAILPPSSQSTKPYIILIEDKNNYSYKSKSLCVYQWNKSTMIKLDSTDFTEKIRDISLKIGKYDKYNIGIFCTYNYNSEFIYSDVYIIRNSTLHNITNVASKGVYNDNKFLYSLKSVDKTSTDYTNYLSLDTFVTDIDEDDILEFRLSYPVISNSTNHAIDTMDYWYEISAFDNTGACSEINRLSYYDTANDYTLILPGSFAKDAELTTTTTIQDYYNITDFYISNTTINSKWIFSVSIYDKLPEGYTYPARHSYNIFISDYGNKTYVITYLEDYFKSQGLSNMYMKNNFFIFTDLLSTPRK